MANYWLLLEHQAAYLRVVRWAQKNRIKVEDLTYAQINEVLRMKD
jgi:hypothetical protein